jgi:hypothetical protein
VVVEDVGALAQEDLARLRGLNYLVEARALRDCARFPDEDRRPRPPVPRGEERRRDMEP